MKSKISSARQSSLHALVSKPSTFVITPLPQKTPSRAPALTLGALWDPFLLDRLQVPLTRHHE